MLGRGRRRDEHLAELVTPLDDVVRRQDRDDGLRVERGERRHGQADRGGVATRVRLDHEVVGPQLGKLLVDQPAVLRRRDDEDALVRDELAHPIHRVLQQAALAEEAEELLGSRLARERPESGSGAAGEHEDVEPWHALLEPSE